MERTPMRITRSKLRLIIRGVLLEGAGDGLNDPQVEKAYYELQNMSRDDFAVDTDFSFLDEWPYSEARDILADEEAAEYEEHEEDTDEARYSEMEDAVRARQGRLNVDDVYDGFQNRGMYEMKYRLMREFGEDDAQLRQKLRNRDKMIGRGIDGGTIGFDPNWDYATNRPLKPKKMHRLKEELQLVADIIQNDFDELALMPGRNGGPPDMFYFTMIGSGIRARCDYKSYSVQKYHSDFTGDGCFISIQNPDNVKGAFEQGAETSSPVDIKKLLEDFIDFAENNIQEDSPFMTFPPTS